MPSLYKIPINPTMHDLIYTYIQEGSVSIIVWCCTRTPAYYSNTSQVSYTIYLSIYLYTSINIYISVSTHAYIHASIYHQYNCIQSSMYIYLSIYNHQYIRIYPCIYISISLSGLEPHRPYECRVRAHNDVRTAAVSCLIPSFTHSLYDMIFSSELSS